MIFNDLAFLFLFLPLTLAGFLLTPPRWREGWLLAASMVFYGVSGLEHVIALSLCVAWVWAFTRSDRIIGSRPILIAAMAGPLAALVYYKYLTFFLVGVLQLPPSVAQMLGIGVDKLLPAGVSFFTFHLLAFAIDRYRGLLPHHPGAAHFGLYICFFPHLVAGPILRYHDVADALRELPRFRPDHAALTRAIGLLCFGMAFKVLVADGLAHHIAPLSAAAGQLQPLAAGYVLFAYSFQIYFDFYGYSLMAMGLAALFGFSFPRNFDRPYESLNPRDFWRRWHMTLGTWIRDYLYIPLGGNRAFMRNILMVFAACGLWHGAAWQFVVWGLYHGLLIVGYQAMRPSWDRLPVLVQRAVTFVLVSLGWVLFLFDFDQARAFAASLLGQAEGALVAAPGLEGWAMLAVAAVCCYGVWAEKAVERAVAESRFAYLRAAGYAGMFVAAVLFLDRSHSFIYFRF